MMKMKMNKWTKIAMMLLFLMISFNSFGEWRPLLEDSDGDTYYIDVNTIKADDDGFVYSWILIDFFKPDSGYMSTKLHIVGDCEQNQIKVPSVSHYTQSMAAGNVATDTEVHEWVPQEPGTIGTNLINFMCNYIEGYYLNSIRVDNDGFVFLKIIKRSII